MKKILISFLILFSLCACTAKEENIEGPLIHEVLEDPSFDEDALYEYLSHREETVFMVSDMIRPLHPDGTASDLKVYAIFCNDSIISLTLCSDICEFNENEKLLEEMNKNEYSLIMETDKGLYYVTKDQIIPFDEEQGVNEKDMKKLEGIKTRITESNPLNKPKRKIEISKPEEKTASKTARIVVRFTEGDEDEKAKKFEEFSKAKFLNRMISAPLYVYQIGYDNEKALKKLLEDYASLEYVETVQIDGQSELIDPVKERE